MDGFFKIFAFAGLALCLAACGGRTEKPFEVAPPQLPAYLSDAGEQAAWFARHFWDNYPFADTTCLRESDYTQKLCAVFFHQLGGLKPTDAQAALHKLLEKALTTAPDSTTRARVGNRFIQWAEEGLYDPNSPLRNEDLYLAIQRHILRASQTDSAQKARAQRNLALASLNRPGSRAADFHYVPALKNRPNTAFEDHAVRLYHLQSPYLLILFNNPYCQACKEVIEELEAAPALRDLQQNKKLQVLALYTDANLEEWNAYLPQMPAHWINAYNPASRITEETLYDLRAIPTLYLLDRDKTVILKDPTVAQVEAWAQNL